MKSFTTIKEYRENFIRESHSDLQKLGHPLPDSQTDELVLGTVFRHMYKKQKEAYNFKAE